MVEECAICVPSFASHKIWISVNTFGGLSPPTIPVTRDQISVVFLRPCRGARATSRDHNKPGPAGIVADGTRDVVITSVTQRGTGEGLVLDTVDRGESLGSRLIILVVLRIFRQTQNIASSPGTAPLTADSSARVY